jgi:hypothetical protein
MADGAVVDPCPSRMIAKWLTMQVRSAARYLRSAHRQTPRCWGRRSSSAHLTQGRFIVQPAAFAAGLHISEITQGHNLPQIYAMFVPSSS